MSNSIFDIYDLAKPVAERFNEAVKTFTEDIKKEINQGENSPSITAGFVYDRNGFVSEVILDSPNGKRAKILPSVKGIFDIHYYELGDNGSNEQENITAIQFFSKLGPYMPSVARMKDFFNQKS